MKVRFKNMATTIRGIHHVTAITSSAPKIWDFFTNQLGLHLIKKSVNQDDVRTYHLYFSDDQGDAGSILTFLIFPALLKQHLAQMKFPAPRFVSLHRRHFHIGVSASITLVFVMTRRLFRFWGNVFKLL